MKHDGPGLLSMSIADRDTLGSQFIVTFKANHHLDRSPVLSFICDDHVNMLLSYIFSI